MTAAGTLFVVLAATYALASAFLAAVVLIAWRPIARRAAPTANDLLLLRLLPAGGAAFVVLTVVLPAFVASEPAQELEEAGPVVMALALVALLLAASGLGRAWRACAAARRILHEVDTAAQCSVMDGQRVDVIDVPTPIVAVVGGLRPRIVASSRVVSACSHEEFQQVIAHERAHVSAHDNLKLLLLVLSPDPLAWLSQGAALEARWRAMAEREADEAAAGADPHQRLALASALVKVARLSNTQPAVLPVLSMPLAVDDVAARVRSLLAEPRPDQRPRRLHRLALCLLVIPVLGVPAYGVVHQLIEALVAFGR